MLLRIYRKSHFLIEKSTDGVKTVTKIERLEPEGSVKELARMLGGASITDAVLENAREMKELAAKKKKMEKVNKKN